MGTAIVLFRVAFKPGKFVKTFLFVCLLGCLFVCLFNRSLLAETHLDLDGTRLKQNVQARLQAYKAACWPSGLLKYKERNRFEKKR